MKAEVAQLAENGILIEPLDDFVQILHTLLCPGKGFSFLYQLRFPASLVLRQHFLRKVIPEQPHIGQRSLNTFQYPFVKRDLPDIMDFTRTRIALVVGADKVIL